jgi:hypothetical protein
VTKETAVGSCCIGDRVGPFKQVADEEQLLKVSDCVVRVISLNRVPNGVYLHRVLGSEISPGVTRPTQPRRSVLTEDKPLSWGQVIDLLDDRGITAKLVERDIPICQQLRGREGSRRK